MDIFQQALYEITKPLFDITAYKHPLDRMSDCLVACEKHSATIALVTVTAEQAQQKLREGSA